jgi:serine/threonine protein kinase
MAMPFFFIRTPTDSFFREMICLQVCGVHPTVLALLGWNLTLEDHMRAFHVTPDMGPGELSVFASPPGAKWLDPTAKLVHAYGVARAMEHVHSLGILHCNLRLENIFYDGHGPKVDVLGLHKAIPVRCADRESVYYMAPEVCANEGCYDLSADVYSYGL